MISRRRFLKTTGATTLALSPFMQQLQLQAASDPVPLPKRFIFVIRSNGLRPYGIVPEGVEACGKDAFQTERLIDTSLVSRRLHPSMQALEPFKDQLTIMQGLSSKVCQGLHGGRYGVLGAYQSEEHAPPRRETIDFTLARKFPRLFPHLAFHIGVEPGALVRYLDVSARGANTRTPAYASASRAYEDLFGLMLTGDRATNQHPLDLLVDDVKRAKQSLDSMQKEKLDHYLHGLEALRDRQVKWGPDQQVDKFTSAIETHRLEAHFDLATAALITGLTNVITIRADELELTYQGFAHERMKSLSLHEIGHIEEAGDDCAMDEDNGREMRNRIRSFQMELMAGMAGKLKAVPEGDGTMLDNTVIVFLSDAGSQHHADFANMPVIVLGNLGRAFKTGRYLHYPSYAQRGHRVLANLHMSLLHAAGMPEDGYGDVDAGLGGAIDQTGPLAEWMA
ncbi:MAG: hypothetical protein ACI9QL_001982 [Candidatus Omnitrophota bacterium]|jgi:hypothetical protein